MVIIRAKPCRPDAGDTRRLNGGVKRGEEGRGIVIRGKR
jgi:hypothetical protein